MNLARTFSKLTQLRSTPLPSTDLEYVLRLQGITIAWLYATWGCSSMLKESIVSETERVREKRWWWILSPFAWIHTGFADIWFMLLFLIIWTTLPTQSVALSSSFSLLSFFHSIIIQFNLLIGVYISVCLVDNSFFLYWYLYTKLWLSVSVRLVKSTISMSIQLVSHQHKLLAKAHLLVLFIL